MGILLNEEELENVLKESWGIGEGDINNSQFKMVAVDAMKAAVKKVFDWGSETCEIYEHDGYGNSRRHCQTCWSEFKKEIGEIE